MVIRITGSPTVIQNIISSNILPTAKQHDRAGFHWLEVEHLSENDCLKVGSMKGKVHGRFSQRPSKR